MSGCSEALQSTSSKSRHSHASSGIDTCSSSTTSWISKTPPALALSPLPGGSTRGSRNSAGVSAARLTGELGGVSSLTRALRSRPSGSFSDTLFWAGVLGVAGADRALRGLRKPSVSATSSGRSGGSWSRSGGVVGTYPSDSSSPAVSNPPSGCGTTSSAGRLKWTITLGLAPTGRAPEFTSQGTPRNSRKAWASHLFSGTRRRIVRALITPLGVPSRCSSLSSERPSHIPGSMAASIFWWRLPPFKLRCLGLGSINRTFSPHGTTFCLYRVWCSSSKHVRPLALTWNRLWSHALCLMIHGHPGCSGVNAHFRFNSAWTLRELASLLTVWMALSALPLLGEL